MDIRPLLKAGEHPCPPPLGVPGRDAEAVDVDIFWGVSLRALAEDTLLVSCVRALANMAAHLRPVPGAGVGVPGGAPVSAGLGAAGGLEAFVFPALASANAADVENSFVVAYGRIPQTVLAFRGSYLA